MGEEEDINYCLEPEPEPDGSAAAKKTRRRRLTKGAIAWIVVAAIVFAILATLLVFWLSFIYVDNTAYVWHPDYDKKDIEPTLDKYFADGEELTDEDYDFLYAQTGVTKIGVDRALAQGSYTGRQKLLDIQDDYFTPHTVYHNTFSIPVACTDELDDVHTVHNIFLEPGDILISSSTHIFGWKMGHCGIVTRSGKAMQAMAYGTPTYEASISYFTERINFMVLRPKAELLDDEACAAASDTALDCKGVEYNALVGIFSKKNSMEHGTQCAHLVWYAYMQQGIDLDSDGGLLVLPNDIANSDKLDLVQTFGFDPSTFKW